MPEAGWYADAENEGQARWHDGSDWTEHRVNMADHQGPPPPPVTAPPAWSPPPAPPVQEAPPVTPSVAPPPAAPPLSPPAPTYAPAPLSRKEAKVQAASAKARAKAMRPWFKKKRIMLPLAIVVIAVIAAAAGGGSNKSKTTTAASGDTTATTAAASHVLHIGDTDTTSGLQTTLLTVESPFKPGPYEPGPAAGKRFIGTELSIKNTSADEQVLSTLLGMSVRDNTGQRFSITIAGLNRPHLDGKVPPGGLLRGWAVFEVPVNATGLKLHIEGALTATGIDYDLGLG